AARWLVEHQNADGGWGESCASYDEPALRGMGASTASQTAWALLGLLAAGDERSDAVRRGVAYLVRTQQPDGQWDEPQFTGTGFPRDFMLKYHLYRNYWPMWALGRYRRLMVGRPIHMPGTDALA
ncbi:MAG: squalene--hopene cyclase, partial [Dehalococcoidia bacterium]